MKKRSEVRAAAAGSKQEGEEGASDRSDESASAVPEAPASAPAIPKVPANPFQWPNANKAKEGELRQDLGRVVETIFVKDIHSEWKDLEAGLEVGEDRSNHGVAVRELDKAAGRAYRAHRLYLTARAARDAWEAENAVTFGAMWSAATASLQKEKTDGIRSKQITDADVENRVATLYPDEFRAQESRRKAVESTVKSLERLAEIWLGKQRDLQAVVGRIRG